MSSNPYERRIKKGDGEYASGGVLRGSTMFGAEPFHQHGSPMTFVQLEAMVATARAQGREEARDAAVEEQRVACHAAWDAGHEAGMTRGVFDERHRLMGLIDKQFLDRVSLEGTRSHTLLGEHFTNAKSVTKARLVDQLERCDRLLTRWVEAHARGYLLAETDGQVYRVELK